MKSLEHGIEYDPPPQTDSLLIDGFFLYLHTMRDVSRTFGATSRRFNTT